QTAPPRYRALKTRLATLDSPLFSLDFSLVDDVKIQSVNREFRGLDKPTDVLSFSQFEDSDGFPVDFPADGDELALGDLMISVETAARQARELGHSLEREIAFLCIHGTLHLLGYDHIQNSDRRVMWKWQDAIFQRLEDGS
ncbi:MAG: rRNA maturation RNase YbeY, partial [Armatimonadetes bacterium]|nr:rRNA maturation RNase YbeY [Armatimonadota bacterium]